MAKLSIERIQPSILNGQDGQNENVMATAIIKLIPKKEGEKFQNFFEPFVEGGIRFVSFSKNAILNSNSNFCFALPVHQ